MASFRVVLVEPEYERNVGAAARLMKNFDAGRLYIVNPKCSLGFSAKMHAKHAADVLEGAKICKSIAEACKGCSAVAGTTGVLRRHKKLLRNPITLEEFSQNAKKGRLSGVVAILFGREGIGLSAREITRCDLLVSIPTSVKYPVMNLSHALAVVLYSLYAQGKEIPKIKPPAAGGEMAALIGAFERLSERQKAHLRNLEKTKLAFRTVIGRAMPDEVEVRCMLGVIRRTLKEKG